jgi:hypothetical protein
MTSSTPEISEAVHRAVGDYQAIPIANPDFGERVDVWHRFADEHPSIQNLDAVELAAMSEGASRRDIFDAGRNAVKTAYRASLRSHAFQPVKLNDVFVAIGPYLDHASLTYSRLEDRAVAEFSKEFDELLGGDAPADGGRALPL